MQFLFDLNTITAGSCRQGEIDMNADAARIGQIAASTEARLSGPDAERDRAIDRIARLLSSGQSIPEILQDIKLTAAGNGATPSKGAAEPGGQTIHRPGDLRDSRSNSETIQSPEPLNETVAHEEVQCLSDPFDPKPTTADTVDPGASGGQQSAQAAAVSRARLAKSLTLLRSALFLAIPVASLAVVAVAGKSLIGSDRFSYAGRTVANTITEAVQFDKNQPVLPSAEAGEIEASRPAAEPAMTQTETVRSDAAEPQAAVGDGADLETPPEGAQAQTTGGQRAAPQTVQPGRFEPPLTSQQIKALLDRGDALVSNADIEAARVPYEQAAAAGYAEAAVRLGATYDPSFLAQAGLRNAGGDALVAQYWYGRARDLEPNHSQFASQATPVVSTVKKADSTTEDGQDVIQTTDATPAKSIQPTPPVSPSQIRNRRRLPERHSRNH